MASSTDALPRIATNPNSLVLIEARVADGRISWLGPLLLVSARSFLLIASQGLVALILLALHHPSPWREAGYWWNIYGTLVDIGCLIGLRYFTRREGIRIRDLVGPIRLRHGPRRSGRTWLFRSHTPCLRYRWVFRAAIFLRPFRPESRRLSFPGSRLSGLGNHLRIEYLVDDLVAY